MEVGRNILAETPRLFREQFADRRAVLVTDASTMAAAGLDVAASLKAAQLPTEEPFIFPSEGLYAEHSFVEQLELSLRQHVAIPIAVGSGTINDLVKLAEDVRIKGVGKEHNVVVIFMLFEHPGYLLQLPAIACNKEVRRT